jgi:hypothetical protein
MTILILERKLPTQTTFNHSQINERTSRRSNGPVTKIMIAIRDCERMQHQSFVDIHGETATITNTSSPPTKTTHSPRQRPTVSNALLVQYSRALELVEDSPNTTNHAGSALGSFMAHLLNDALIVADNPGDQREDRIHKQEKSFNNLSNEKNDSRCHNRCNNKELVVVSDNAKLPFQGKTHPNRRCPQRSYSDRAEIIRETRWSTLNARNPRCAGLTAPVRSDSLDAYTLQSPKIEGRSTENKGRTHKDSQKKMFSADTIPSYPYHRRGSA